MSTDVKTRPPTLQLPPKDFQLRGGVNRRNWLAAAAVLGVIVVLLVVLLSKGSSSKSVRGSHFGTTLPIAYEASSSSEQAFLQWLKKAIAPTYGVKIETGQEYKTATSSTKRPLTVSSPRTSTSTFTGSTRSSSPPA